MNEELISQIPLFAALPASEIHYLAETLKLRQIPPGATLIHEGGSDNRFYILLEGQVEVFKTMIKKDPSDGDGSGDDPILIDGNERSLAVLNPGALIGEMSIFSHDGQHTASVRALNPLQVLEMARQRRVQIAGGGLRQQKLQSHGQE